VFLAIQFSSRLQVRIIITLPTILTYNQSCHDIFPGVIVSVVGRDGQLYAHDDSVALLLAGDDGIQNQAQESEQQTAQTTWKEMPDMPPPYAP
jgi:hypothetical protein